MKKKILNFIKKKNKSKIVSLTAYSKNIASILDNFCDLILVGDSLGSVLYNYKSTREVTLNMMIEHSKSVRMAVKKSLMVVDMPYNTYRNSKEALINAKKIMTKTKCSGIIKFMRLHSLQKQRCRCRTTECSQNIPRINSPQLPERETDSTFSYRVLDNASVARTKSRKHSPAENKVV